MLSVEAAFRTQNSGLQGGAGSRDRTPMVCRSGADRTVLTGVTEVVLPAAQGPEGAGGGDLAATIQPAFNTAAASETCATISTTSADGTTVSRPNTKVKVLWEVDGTFVAAEHGGSVTQPERMFSRL